MRLLVPGLAAAVAGLAALVAGATAVAGQEGGPGDAWRRAEPVAVPRDSLSDALRVLQDTLLVTVTREAHDPLSLPQAANVVTRAELERHAPVLLLDALRGEAGVLVQQTTAGQAAPIIRGLTGSHVLLLVDGVPLNNGTFRQGPSQYLSTVDPASVERIEVVRGPSSVLYGSDGIGGVVNVVTKKPARPGDPVAPAVARTSAASATRLLSQRLEGELRLAGLGSLGARGGLTYLQTGDVDPGGDLPAQSPTAFDGHSGDLALFLPLTHGGLDLGVQYSSLDDVPGYDRLVDFRAPALGRDALFLFDVQERLSLRAALDTRLPGSAAGRLGAVVYALDQREGRRSMGLVEGPGGEPVSSGEIEAVRDDVLSYGAQLQGRGSAPGGVRWTAGVDARANRVEASGYVERLAEGTRIPLVRLTEEGPVASGRFPDGSRFESLAAFALAERELGPLTASGGARLGRDHVRAPLAVDQGGTVDRSFTSRVFAAGAVLRLAPGLRVVAHVGEGFRAPNVYDFSTLSEIPGGVLIPNPDLEPERSLTWEGGLKWRLAAGGAAAARGSLTAHRTVIRGLLDRVPAANATGDTLVGGRRAFTTANVSRARAYGVEADAGLALGSGAYAELAAWWTRGDQWDAGAGREPMTRIPPLSGELRLGWQWRAGRWLEYGLRAAGSQRRLSAREERDSRIQPGGTPGYAVHAVQGGLRLGTRADLTLGVENLFDRLYRDHGSGIDNPGRSFWGSVRLEL